MQCEIQSRRNIFLCNILEKWWQVMVTDTGIFQVGVISQDVSGSVGFLFMSYKRKVSFIYPAASPDSG